MAMQAPQFPLPTFLHTNPLSIITAPALFIILALFFVVYSVLTGMLMYHWSAYGMKSQGVLVAESLFIFVSIILFLTAGFGLYYF